MDDEDDDEEPETPVVLPPEQFLDIIAAKIMGCSVMELRSSHVRYRDLGIMTYTAIMQGRQMKFDRLKQSAELDKREFSGEVRTFGDWLIGVGD